jgi:hypothetical protein
MQNVQSPTGTGQANACQCGFFGCRYWDVDRRCIAWIAAIPFSKGELCWTETTIATPMTANDFRKLALSLPEVIEAAHMHHPDFRVGGRIFATLGYPNQDWAMVKLSTDEQREFVQTNPKVFKPVKGGWGRQGSTNIYLPVAKVAIVRKALSAAWHNIAPKQLSKDR